MTEIICVKKIRKKRIDNIENRVDTSSKALRDYVKKSKERLITATNYSSDNINTDR